MRVGGNSRGLKSAPRGADAVRVSTFQLEALCLVFGLIFAAIAGGGIGYLVTPAIDRLLDGRASGRLEAVIFAGVLLITLRVLWS